MNVPWEFYGQNIFRPLGGGSRESSPPKEAMGSEERPLDSSLVRWLIADRSIAHDDHRTQDICCNHKTCLMITKTKTLFVITRGASRSHDTLRRPVAEVLEAFAPPERHRIWAGDRSITRSLGRSSLDRWIARGDHKTCLVITRHVS